jgi:hypothetical protein
VALRAQLREDLVEQHHLPGVEHQVANRVARIGMIHDLQAARWRGVEARRAAQALKEPARGSNATVNSAALGRARRG